MSSDVCLRGIVRQTAGIRIFFIIHYSFFIIFCVSLRPQQ